jgi:hypothetical protein
MAAKNCVRPFVAIASSYPATAIASSYPLPLNESLACLLVTSKIFVGLDLVDVKPSLTLEECEC